ncbi:MAG: glycerophosphodiester phosphodiesterase [Clostridia bacterium]|nr:glycerophosphodiester phosphodiesterase [Clostridia bacterium]
MKKNMMITAHNGCEGIPDHTLACIRKGIEVGADCVEIDVRADENGKLWLIHDLPADFSGLVPLEEAFALIQESGVAVNCDLKEERAFLPTIALADRCGIGPRQLIFSGSVDIKVLEARPELAKRSRVFLNTEVLVKDLTKIGNMHGAEQTAYLLAHAREAAERFHTLGAEALNASYRNMPDELIAKMRERDVPLSLWTLNSEEVLREFMAKDVFNITTRIPTAALRIREERLNT